MVARKSTYSTITIRGIIHQVSNPSKPHSPVSRMSILSLRTDAMKALKLKIMKIKRLKKILLIIVSIRTLAFGESNFLKLLRHTLEKQCLSSFPRWARNIFKIDINFGSKRDEPSSFTKRNNFLHCYGHIHSTTDSSKGDRTSGEGKLPHKAEDVPSIVASVHVSTPVAFTVLITINFFEIFSPARPLFGSNST